MVLQDERCRRGRRSRVVLAPRRWRQVRGPIHERRGQESPVPGKQLCRSRPAIGQGSRLALRAPAFGG